MKYHRTKNGNKIKLSDLELSHLQNIIKLIDRKATEGLTIRMGGGSTAEDMRYDEDTYYGEAVRKKLNYYDYKAELYKREE